MDSLRIISFEAENFKPLRVVRIHPNGRMVQITGKNGAGKTSVLDAVWFALKGRKALPTQAVRKGQEQMKVVLKTGEFTVTRTLSADGALPTLTLEMAPGVKRTTTPQEFLDSIFGELTFDPLDFIRARPGEIPAQHRARQIAMLRATAKVDLDFEALAAENEKDYEARRLINIEVGQLDTRVKNMTVLEGLPKNKLNEEVILKKLNDAGEANRQAQQIFQRRQELGAEAARLGIAQRTNEQYIAGQRAKIEQIENELRLAKDALKAAETQDKRLSKEHAEAEKAYQAAPTGEPIDVTALTVELQSAQRTNRAIDARAEYDRVSAELESRKAESTKLTLQMDAREDKKKAALAKAKIPVDGLTFDERRVSFKGLPLENLGEAEQIRISAQIGMAANPRLRVLFIRNGEALDEDGMTVLAELAEEYDFQIWMARVDSSGKVGIVLQDGMVVAENPEPAAKKKPGREAIN